MFVPYFHQHDWEICIFVSEYDAGHVEITLFVILSSLVSHCSVAGFKIASQNADDKGSENAPSVLLIHMEYC